MLEFEPGRSVDGDGPCRLACADGDMMNHARRPNCRYKLDRDTVPGETLVRIVTTRSVPRGAESSQIMVRASSSMCDRQCQDECKICGAAVHQRQLCAQQGVATR